MRDLLAGGRGGPAGALGIVAIAITVLGAQAPPAVLAIHAARIIDGRGGTPLSGMVIVRGDRIEAVGRDLAVPAGARVIDLGGATLLPGLIDLHTHLTSTGVHWEDELLRTTPGQAALHGAKNARDTLMAGFTTCRDMGPTWPFTDIDLRDAIDQGVVPGPRMMASGNYVSATGGAGDARQFSIFVDVPIVQNLADGPDAIRHAVRVHAHGVVVPRDHGEVVFDQSWTSVETLSGATMSSQETGICRVS